jgi:hypothetical protein
MLTNISSEILKKRNQLGKPCVCKKIILKRILKEKGFEDVNSFHMTQDCVWKPR